MDRYAFFLVAMTMAEAKETLGFNPNSTPSDAEVAVAFRMRARKLHPDVAGDSEENLKAFKALEAAKSILLGKLKPTYDRNDPRPSGNAPTSAPTWTPPKKNEVSFEEAKSKAGIPSDVNWLFVTPMQRGKGWSSDESSMSNRAFVVYGRTDKMHVFLSAYNYSRRDYFVGGSHNDDVWTLETYKTPIKKDEGSNPAWLYRQVVKSLKDSGFEGRFNSKVIDAEGWRLSPKLPAGSTTSIKHWLVNSGQVSGDAAAVSNRKHVVEIKVDTTRDNKPGYYPEPKTRTNYWDNKYWGEYWKVTLNLNGKPYVLSAGDTEKFLKAGLKGKKLTNVIFGDYIYGSSTKQLSRMRTAGPILEWMTTRFDDLPKDAMEILKATLAQKGGK